MSSTTGLDTALDAYLAAMSVHCADFVKHFSPPAPPTDMAALGRTLGAPAPIQLARLLARHDGSGDAMVVPEYRLLSTAVIAEEWLIWEDLRINDFDPRGLTCSPEGPIRRDHWWNSAWIPFAADGTGNFLCIDTDPARGGSNGQIITMWHDDDRRNVVAPCL